MGKPEPSIPKEKLRVSPRAREAAEAVVGRNLTINVSDKRKSLWNLVSRLSGEPGAIQSGREKAGQIKRRAWFSQLVREIEAIAETLRQR